MKSPHIRTPLPGPKAEAMLKRSVAVESPSYPRDYPFVMSHGKGAEVWDVDGNRFLDFMAGIAVCSTGHSHPQVVQAIKDAADKFLHISSDYWHEGQIALAEKMNALSPMREPTLSFFCQSGTESVEGALKLARYVTGRGRFIGFLGGFHGRTMGSLVVHVEQVHPAEGLLPDDAGRHARAVSEQLSPAASRVTIRARRCSTTSRTCCSSRTCRRAKSRRS